MDQELFGRFKKCAVEVLSVSEDQVVPDATLLPRTSRPTAWTSSSGDGAGKEFSIEVPEEELEDIKSSVRRTTSDRQALNGSPWRRTARRTVTSPGSAWWRPAASARGLLGGPHRPGITVRRSIDRDWDPSPLFATEEARWADRVDQFALAAAAGRSSRPVTWGRPDRFGTIFATGVGG